MPTRPLGWPAAAEQSMQTLSLIHIFTCVLGGAGMLLALIGTIANLDPLTWIALAIVLLALARAFSKNITVRCNENNAFRSFSERVPVLGNLVARLEMCIRDRYRHAGMTIRSNSSAAASLHPLSLIHI